MITPKLIRLIKKVLLAFFVLMYFMVCFRIISRIPVGIVNELLSLFYLLILIAVFVHETGSQFLKGRVSILFIIFLPLLVLPLINAAQAQEVFGQPFKYGLLSQRYHYFILGAFLVVVAMKRRWISPEKMEKYFVYSMYLTLMVMYFFYIFINPVLFSGTEFVKLTGYKGWIYEFPNGATAGLLIYSAIKFLKDNKKRHIVTFLLSIIFFFVYGQDRSQIAISFIVLLVFYFLHMKPIKIIFYSITGIFLGGLVVVLLILFTPDFISHYTELFGNALTIFTGEQTTEYSTNIRHYEAAVALEGFDQHPWLGNGFLSSQWNEGYLQFHRYFYPADIGLLGNLYVFGIIGTIFYYIPYIAVFIWAMQMKKFNDAFALTAIYTLLFIFLDMQSAANNIKFIGSPAFFMGVVYYYRFYVYPGYKESLQQERLTEAMTRPKKRFSLKR